MLKHHPPHFIKHAPAAGERADQEAWQRPHGRPQTWRRPGGAIVRLRYAAASLPMLGVGGLCRSKPAAAAAPKPLLTRGRVGAAGTSDAGAPSAGLPRPRHSTVAASWTEHVGLSRHTAKLPSWSMSMTCGRVFAHWGRASEEESASGLAPAYDDMRIGALEGKAADAGYGVLVPAGNLARCAARLARHAQHWLHA